MVIVVVAVVLVAAGALWLIPAVRRAAPARTPQALRVAALVLALLAAALSLPAAWSDAGGFALVALGLPVVVALASVLGSASRLSVALTWVAALLMLVWALLLGLGLGLVLLPAAVVQALAAITQHRPGRPAAVA